MGFYSEVETKTPQIGGLISLALGLCLIVSSCWLLHRTLSSESLVYYTYGVRVGGSRLEPTNHIEAYNFLASIMSPYVRVLKISASIGIIGGILQVGTSFLTLRKKENKLGLRIWLGSVVMSLLLSLTTLILPVTYRLTQSDETKILLTVAAINAFIHVHLFIVVLLQLRSRDLATATESDPVAEPAVVIEGNPTASRAPAAAGSDSAGRQR